MSRFELAVSRRLVVLKLLAIRHVGGRLIPHLLFWERIHCGAYATGPESQGVVVGSLVESEESVMELRISSRKTMDMDKSYISR